MAEQRKKNALILLEIAKLENKYKINKEILLLAYSNIKELQRLCNQHNVSNQIRQKINIIYAYVNKIA